MSDRDKNGRFKKGSLVNLGRHHSMKTKDKIRKSRTGKCVGIENPEWKGDKSSYASFHIWLSKHHGRPKRCQNIDCVYPRKNARGKLMMKPSRIQWALIKGKKHSHNINNYIGLCASCHKLYDLR